MSADVLLEQAVMAELAFEPSLSADHIAVTVEDGVVTLIGHVSTYAQKHAAETAARRVRDVKGVIEEIEVRLPPEAHLSDRDLAAAAVERLAWDVAIPTGAIEVKVEKGWVILSGAVPWRYQKEFAQDDIRRLRGVVGISNQISVRPPGSAADPRAAIRRALQRGGRVDPAAVHVEADGGRLTLSGSVRTLHEWRSVSAAAWRAPGVSDVENDIEIL